MANKKPLWQRKHVTHEEFEEEAKQIEKEINERFKRMGIDKASTNEYEDCPDDAVF